MYQIGNDLAEPYLIADELRKRSGEDLEYQVKVSFPGFRCKSVLKIFKQQAGSKLTG
jgi:hypothetical protein